MLKSVYDPNADGVIAVAQTEADMKKSVYDTDDDAKVDAIDEHASSHEAGGTDEIDATDLVGAGGAGILGDGTAGRVLRSSRFIISNGTDATTIKCQLVSRWNGDDDGPTDNISKDSTVENYSLDINGFKITIATAALTATPLQILLGTIPHSSCATALYLNPKVDSNNLIVEFYDQATGAVVDLTTLVDTGSITLHLLYITDA